MLAVEDPDTAPILDSWYQPTASHSCRLSLITSPTGEVVGADGTSQSLSNPADRAILLAQRRSANAVITGAKTVRAEPVPIPAHAPLIVLSRTGVLAGHQITHSTMREQSVIVITGTDYTVDPTSFFPREVARHHVLGTEGSVTATAVVDYLRSENYLHLLVEGGREVAGLFAGEGAFDELCVSLTGAPRAENHPPIPWWQKSWGTWTSRHVLTDDLRTLYFRYQPEGEANSRDSAR